ncbi:MAG: ATP-binding cassette domain-containing protein [Thiotrichaceae bacterium]
MTIQANQQEHSLIMSLRNVGLSYRRKRGVFGDEFWALKDVSFDLYQGDTLGIIGRNGVGKSTLLRLMAGIMQPSRGELNNHGYQASLLSLQLGFIYYLSGRENAILSGMFLGLRKREILERMDSIIEFAELGDFIDQPIGTILRECWHVWDFRAFQVDPDVLLIDEILGVGDAEFYQKSTRMMQENPFQQNDCVCIPSCCID